MPIINTSSYVSEFTQKTLEQFGWQAGDPLPENMNELIKKIMDKGLPCKKPGVLVDVDAMSEEDIEEVEAALQNAKIIKEHEEKMAGINETAARLAPGVQEAYKQLAALNAQNNNAEEETESVEVLDDRQSSDATEEKSKEEAKEESKEKEPPIEPQKPEKKDTTAAAGVIQPDALTDAQPAFCPRCDWDMRLPYEVDMTPADKENFLVTILSGSRFKKDYEVFNGKYTVIFRTLSAEENKKIHRQLVLEQRAGEFFSDTEWFLRFFEYRLACSVESIIVNEKLVALVPELSEIEGQPLPAKTDDTSLPALIRLHKYVVGELLNSEIIRRLTSKKFREFQRLYEALEAMALEPNFW